jgi:hypothetical protein
MCPDTRSSREAQIRGNYRKCVLTPDLALSDMQGVEQVGGDSPTMPSGSIDPVTDGILVDIDDTVGTPQRMTFGQVPHRDRVMRFLHAYTEVRRALAHRKCALTLGT